MKNHTCKEVTYITTLKGLKRWNSNPTIDKPVVLDWFMDWVFVACFIPLKDKLVVQALQEIIKFTMICEKKTYEDSVDLVINNILFWNDRASYNLKDGFEGGLLELKKEILQNTNFLTTKYK